MSKSLKDVHRVVVTGMGVVSPLGLNETALWANLMAGKSGINQLTLFDTQGLKTTTGAEVNSQDLASSMQSLGIPAFDRTVDMALVASHQALYQARLIHPPAPYPAQDMPVILGSSAGGVFSQYESYKGFFTSGVRGVRPTSVPRGMANAVSSQTSMLFRLTGPNYVTASACTSATTAIGIAFRMIRDGYATRALCGGSDTVFSPAMFSAWNNLGVMSRNPNSATACRPFDVARDGCVLGEGAAILILESEASAQQRDAVIRAEILGFGESSDAEHITRPSAEGQTRAIRAAILSADIQPVDIGFVNAHGTATPANDECECQSIRLALGAAADDVPVASNKSFFGHLLGASGAIEAVVTILGLENRKVPANLNLDNPDPKCNARLVGSQPMDVAKPIAMKNSFGFGGNNAVLIIQRRER